MKYLIEGKELNVNGKSIKFDHLIRTVLEKDRVLVTLIMEDDIPGLMKYYHSRNIFGVSAEGEILWQVEAPSDFKEDLFTSLGINNEDNVEAYSWKGCENIIDPKTGKILKQEFVRF